MARNRKRPEDASGRSDTGRALAAARSRRADDGVGAQAEVRRGSTDPLPEDEDGLYDELGYDAEPGERDPSVADGGGSGGGRVGGRGGGGGDGSGQELTPGGRGSAPGHPARPNPMLRLVRFLQGSWRELQRVQWPDRPQVVQATGVVIGFVIVAGILLAAGDWVAQKIVNFVIG